jgi:hypothetical protein
MPQISVPDLPALGEMSAEDLKAFNALPPSTQKYLLDNDSKLKLTVRQQKAAIDVYNAFAKDQNDKNAAVLGLPVEPKKEDKK